MSHAFQTEKTERVIPIGLQKLKERSGNNKFVINIEQMQEYHHLNEEE